MAEQDSSSGARAKVEQLRRDDLAQRRAGLSSRMETRIQQNARPRPLRRLSDFELGELWEEADRPNAGGRARGTKSGEIRREMDIREGERGGR